MKLQDIFDQDILNAIILAIATLGLFGLAEILYHYIKVKVEFTRKLVHFGTGVLTLLFPVMLANHWLVLVLCTGFAFMLLLSLKFRLLPSINAIERKSVGALAYPVAVYGCYLVFEYNQFRYFYFYLPMLLLAVCDPVAALAGKSWPFGKYTVGRDNKTLVGSGMFFGSALLVSFLLIPARTGSEFIVLILVIALVTTLTEAISGKGSDNLTIPFSALITLIIWEQYI